MGCHTWVYANPKTYNKAEVTKLAEEIAKEWIDETVKLQQMTERLVNDEAFKTDVKLQLATYLQKHKHTFTLREIADRRKNLADIDVWLSEFDDKDLAFYIKHVFYGGCISKLDDIENETFIDIFKEHLLQCTTDITTEDTWNTAIDRHLGLNGNAIRIADRKNCVIYTETEIHDPFRFYDYDAPEFFSREDLEAYVLADENIDKLHFPRYPQASNLVKRNMLTEALDKIYTKYPDAAIDFG